jgi:uncharacterized protein (TIGR03437 family)
MGYRGSALIRAGALGLLLTAASFLLQFQPLPVRLSGKAIQGGARSIGPAAAGDAVSGRLGRGFGAQTPASYRTLPLRFEPAAGPPDAPRSFVARGGGYRLALTADEALIAATPALPRAVVRVKLIGADAGAPATAPEPLPGKSNYLIGNDPARWRTNVPTYQRIGYRDVYPGVDVVYYGSQGQLEYDFIVAPDAEPSRIRMAVEGADSATLDAGGDLVLQAGGGELRLRKPVLYQEVEGNRREIAGAFALAAANSGSAIRNPNAIEVGFVIGAYDASQPLVIDPVILNYSTTFSGGGEEEALGIAVDAAGNAYVAGWTSSVNFPTASPLQAGNAGGTYDAFVAKLSASGTVLYSTYLGGNAWDFGFGIAVDASGNAYVSGFTHSTNFPTTPGAFQPTYRGSLADCPDPQCGHAFVAKLNPTGSALVYSTYLGGGGGAPDAALCLAVDSSGSAYVAGLTASSDFPVTPGAVQTSFAGYVAGRRTRNAFVTKLNPSGSGLVYSTYLGGTGGGGESWAYGIALDASGNAYVTGGTQATSFPVTPGAFQTVHKGGGANGFVSKINAAGSALVYSTYLSGSGSDNSGIGIAVDASGNAIVAGLTGSTDFPIASPLQAANAGGIDAFVTKLNASGSGLVYSTYLGGAGSDAAWGVAVDGSGNAYVAGFLWIGGGPALLAKFSAGGALADSYSLSMPGRAGGGGVTLDGSGNIYLSGFNSFTAPFWFTNCPLKRTPEATPHHGFVAKLQAQATIPTNPLPAISSLSPAGATAGDAGFTLTVIGANFLPGSVVRWNGADRSTTYVSGSQLSATISANDIGTAGTAQVTVFNPAPGGGLSNTLGFVIGSAPQPALAVSPASLSLSATLGGPAATSALQVGSVGGAVSWTASTTVLNGGNWLSVSPSSGTSTPAQPVLLALQANPAAPGAAGLYQAVITLTASAGKSVTVPVTLSVGQGRPRLRLSHTALVFSATQDAAAPPPQTVSIFNALPGSGTLNWSAAAASANWLSVSPASGAASCTSATSCSPGLAKMSVNAVGLAPGVYQAMVTVSAAEAGNTELLSVSLQVTAASTTPTPSALLAPYGLFFTVAAGGSAPPAQSITVSNAGDGTLSFQFSVATFSGGNWLTVSPAAGDTTTGPVTASLSVSPAGLAQGVYRGRVVSVFNSGSPQEVDVMLAVGAGASGSFAVAPAAWNGAAADCTPQSMQLMAETIGSGTSMQVSWPWPLVAFVVDNCGTPVADATVVASVEGHNIPLQRLVAGKYSGTWVPSQIASAVVLKLTATHPSFSSVATQSFTLKVSTAPGNVQLPAILQDGIVEGAGFTPRRPLAPGGIISIFGTQLASGKAQEASKLPLERELNGVSVRVGTLTAPLYYVGPDQINAQLPFEAAAADTVSIAVVTQGRITSPCAYAVAPAQPGIFRAGANAAVLDGQSRLVTPDNAARIGDVLQIFATGLGATDVAVQTGAPAPAFSTVRLPITATIGGVQATVVYQGLAPGFVGLYQVNVVVPEGVTPGSAVPLVLRQNGLVSNPDSPITIPVQAR